MLTVSFVEQPLKSANVTIYAQHTTQQRLVVFEIRIIPLEIIRAVPPKGVAVAVPSQTPLQLASVVVDETDNVTCLLKLTTVDNH